MPMVVGEDYIGRSRLLETLGTNVPRGYDVTANVEQHDQRFKVD